MRPIEVALGISDGTVTEISGEGLSEGTQIVVGEEGKEGAGADDTADDSRPTNPFLPKLPKGAKPPPPR